MRRTRGFTLLELLVVLTMVGVLATTVTLSLAPDTHRQLQDEAWRFARVLEAASEQAEHGDPLALSWQPDGYRFQRQADDGQWQPLNDDPLLSAHNWPDGIHAAQPQALLPLTGDGRITARLLSLRTTDRALTVALSPLGRASVQEGR